MRRVHTHYDNLKVARDASPEAIRAAYLQLTRRYHPDRNPGDAEAARIMALVNAAYAVLSDPVRRAEHDRWLQHQEASAARAQDPARLRRPRAHAHWFPPRWTRTIVKLRTRCMSLLRRLRGKSA